LNYCKAFSHMNWKLLYSIKWRIAENWYRWNEKT